MEVIHFKSNFLVYNNNNVKIKKKKLLCTSKFNRYKFIQIHVLIMSCKIINQNLDYCHISRYGHIFQLCTDVQITCFYTC